jgi:hypothetical protein
MCNTSNTKIKSQSIQTSKKTKEQKQDCALLPLPSLLRLSISWKRTKAIDQDA